MPQNQYATRARPHLRLSLLLWSGLIALLAAVFIAPSSLFGFDGLSAVICTLTLFVGAIITAFSQRYMRSDPRKRRYFILVTLIVASILGFVLARNLLVFAIAWCASGVLLGELVGHASSRGEGALAARRVRLTFAVGDLSLLAALALLGWQAGSFQIAAVKSAAAYLPLPVVTLAALLMLVAGAARCALPPFSGWLQSSMTAPTPVSALMHAGLVNAGGFLLLRFAPVFEAAPIARYATVAVGLFASLWGIGVMSVRPDIKRSLAGSTVSQMGFMIMSCGLGAYTAALWHIVAHGLFKAWLFLGSGSAVGIKPDRKLVLGSQRSTAIAALVALVVGSVLAFTGQAGSELIPLLLGITTACTTALASFSGKLPRRAGLSIAGLLAALAGLYALGFTLVHVAAGLDGPVLLSPPATIALLAAFLGSWVWQSRRMEQGKPLPPALYVHLLNSGALATDTTGDAQ